MKDGRLEGRRALITGVAGGIGGASATLFSLQGAEVWGVDLPGGAAGPSDTGCRTSLLDLTDPLQVEGLFEEIRREWGWLDILFNVAGGSGRRWGDGPVDSCTWDGWRKTLSTNLDTAFLCCKGAIPLMAERGGSIINLSSVLGTGAHELFATHAYAAAKGALISLTRSMSRHYAPQGIRVNAIAPGLVRTAMSRRASEDEATLRALTELQPLTGDLGEAGDVAAAALFLAGDESRFITGVVLPVDGGWSTL